MCWFLYGAVNGDIDEKGLDKINSTHRCRLTQGTKHELKTAVLSYNCDYRITAGFRVCDYESEIGTHHTDAVEVIGFAALLNEICALPGAKTVSFCKTWVRSNNFTSIQNIIIQKNRQTNTLIHVWTVQNRYVRRRKMKHLLMWVPQDDAEARPFMMEALRTLSVPEN